MEKKPGRGTLQRPTQSEPTAGAGKGRPESIRASQVPSELRQDLSARIARKAYELFEQRGKSSGHELDDWLEAERLVEQEIGQTKEASPAPRRV